MADDSDRSASYRLWPINRRILLGVSVIGAIAALILVCFAYVGGLFAPGRLTQAGVIDGFEALNGLHPGFRRNHAKGVCVTGYFESNGNGVRISRAVVFEPGRIPVIGRFSVPGGKPFAADRDSDVHALALSFRPPNGEEWRTAMINIPVFPVTDVQGFYAFLFATAPDPATGKPDPQKVKAFFAAHPESERAVGLIKARMPANGFANTRYNALHAFRFVNAAGDATPVRWSALAVDPFVAVTPDQPEPADKNFLFDALIARIEQGPVQWHLVATVGQPGDPTNDATLPWPADREQVDLGTVTIEHAEAEAPGNCRDINFDPLVLPAGIEPSDDPLPSARSATYSTSFTRRAGEEKTPSAVQIPAPDATSDPASDKGA